MKKGHWSTQLTAAALCIATLVGSVNIPAYAAEISNPESTAAATETAETETELTIADETWLIEIDNTDDTAQTDNKIETFAPSESETESETEIESETETTIETEAPETTIPETTPDASNKPLNIHMRYTSTPTPAQILIEKKIFTYLTEKLNLNAAAAIGILVNINTECDYDQRLQTPIPGTDSYYYGLCQWTSDRLGALMQYRPLGKPNDYTTVEGQLDFIAYELTEDPYRADTLQILKKLQAVTNDAAGAGDAASIFCILYEGAVGPDSRKQTAMNEFGAYYKRITGNEWTDTFDPTVNFTGLYDVDGITYYFKDGVRQDDYSGLVFYENIWCYVENGIYDGIYTGLVLYKGAWFYVENGLLNWNYTGLCQYRGSWFYVEKGQLNWNYTGLCQYKGAWFYVEKGQLNWNYTGLCQYRGSWFYVEKGQLNWNYTGLCQYRGSWFYVEKGQLNWNYTGLCQYRGAWFYIEKGQLNWNYTGLCQYRGSWFYVEKGQLNWNYTGLCQYRGDWFYVEKGQLNWNYTGLCQYRGTWFYVQNSYLKWNYNGPVKHNNTWYYVKGSIAKYTFTKKGDNWLCYKIGTDTQILDLRSIIGQQSNYYIRVNKTGNAVTVYANILDGSYNVPIVAFVCSAGDPPSRTPSGTFNTYKKGRWAEMMGGVYGQWITGIYGGIWFHSVYYNSYNDADNLSVSAYNNLGSPASHGCIRLAAGDAKWIYDNCQIGTTVKIYEDASNPGPLGKPTAYKLPSWHTWDPTDPTRHYRCEQHGCH